MRNLTLLYHEVTNNPNDSGFQRLSALPYKHPIDEFLSHIDLIMKSKIEVLTINDLDLLEKNDSILLTFDDGGKSAMYIADVLDERSIKGHFFITTKMIGNRYFVNKNNIVDLYKRGHIIGSHSHSHPNIFRSLSINQMNEEWYNSKLIIEEILGKEIFSCSIPGGDADINTYESAFNTGFKFVFNSDPKLSFTKFEENYIIGRVCPKQGEKLNKIQRYLEYKGIILELYKRKIKNTLKKSIYPLYYYLREKDKHNG